MSQEKRQESRECRGHGRSAQGSLIGFITVMDSAVSKSEVIHLHVMNIN